MTLIQGTLPYDIANLLAGAARVVISDDSASLPAVPTNLKDIQALTSPYAPKTGWVDVGATTDGTSYTRDMDSEGYEIEQSSGTIFEDITETTRTLQVQMGEIKPEHLKIVEESQNIATLTAVATQSTAQKAVKFGSITQLTNRRVAFVGQRNRRSGEVEETVGSRTRGRFVALVLYNVTISADATEIQVSKGSLASAPVTFKAYPEDGLNQGEEYGVWLLEESGTI